MTTPKKTTARKAPQKKAPARKAPPRKYPTKRPTRPPGSKGPAPIVLRGFTRRMLRADRQDDLIPADPWTEHAPARRVLISLRAGSTWALAGQMARLHEATPRAWYARGQNAIAGHDDLPALETTGVDDETLAYAAFYVLAEQAFAIPGVGALNTISRAAQSEWRAAGLLLRVLPQTKREYAEVTKLEHSGPDGEAIPIEVRAAALAAQLRARLTDAGLGDDGEELDGDDGAGEG